MYRRSFVLNLLTMISWSFVSLFVSLALALFCVLFCFKKLEGVMDPIEDCFSTRDLEIVDKHYLVCKMFEELQ